jgi:hypothetical protein
MEKERELLKDTDVYRCESVEISGKSFYAYFHVSYIKDADRLAEFGRVAGAVPLPVARLKAGDKLVEFYHIVIHDIYGGDLYIKRITEDRTFKKYGILYISYHEYDGHNYVMPYREKDEFGEADEFDFLVYREMMEDMWGYLEKGAEILYLSEDKYDPVEYMMLVEGAG